MKYVILNFSIVFSFNELKLYSTVLLYSKDSIFHYVPILMSDCIKQYFFTNRIYIPLCFYFYVNIQLL